MAKYEHSQFRNANSVAFISVSYLRLFNYSKQRTLSLNEMLHTRGFPPDLKLHEVIYF